MPNYSTSSIQKICGINTEIKDTYIGSTTNFRDRKYHHKGKCHNSNDTHYNLNVYKFIRENGGWTNWEIKEVETVDHDYFNTSLAREREAFWFKELNATLNNNIPNQSHRESCKMWYKKNPEYFHDYGIEYYNKIY